MISEVKSRLNPTMDQQLEQRWPAWINVKTIAGTYWLCGLAAIAGIEVFGRSMLSPAIIANVDRWGKTRDKEAVLSVPKR